MTYGEKGDDCIEWKWLIGPFPLPISVLVLIPASTYRQAPFTALTILIPFARFEDIAATST